jgi:post-segregation antitoxin (ccd killing protein)
MQTVDLKITLPDQVAQEALAAGLITEPGVERLIEEAVRREAGERLLDAMRRLREANVPPLTEEEIAAEVAAARTRWRLKAVADTNIVISGLL